MTTKRKLSATMAIALGDTVAHGGLLIRHVGGYWAWPGAPKRDDGLPAEYYGTSTVQALVDRGELVYIGWHEGLPIIAEIPQAPYDAGPGQVRDGEA